MHEQPVTRRTIELEPGSPEWVVQQELDTVAAELRRTLPTLTWDSDLGYYLGVGMVFIHRCITTTSLFDRSMLDYLLLRLIGSAATLLEQASFAPDPKEKADAIMAQSVLNDLLHDLHGLRLKLPELGIQQAIIELSTTTKESHQ